MAGTGITIRVKSNHIPKIAAEMAPTAAKIVKAHGYLVEAKAKGYVPVRTGTLRRSIHTVLSNRGLTATVGPSVLYGKFVEFGTRRMGARPYMRPAAEYVLPGFLAAMKNAIGHFNAGFRGADT